MDGDDATVGLILSEMQLEIDHLKDKMIKSGIDINIGDEAIVP